MPDSVQFDAFQVKLLMPADTDEATADAARAALDNPSFLESVRQAIQSLLATVPALAVLTASPEW